MLAVVYLLVCFMTGYAVCSCMIPEVFSATGRTYGKRNIKVSPVLLWFPASFITGIILVTWSVYILGNVFSTSRTPLVAANVIAMIFYIPLSVYLLFWKKKKGELKRPEILCKSKKNLCTEGIFFLLFFVLSTALMFYTFYVKDGNICIGYSVYSDFSPHMSMIRSFSYGNNFPTWYPYFAGIDVKYHFMFQFLTGNMEFLGMRLDYAFNVPSIMSMMFVYMLLYVLTVKITGKPMAGVIAGLLFSFRSSESLFTYLSEAQKGENLWTRLKENTEFIGYTTNENWGLWNLNVYANQRHLALCLAILLLAIILVLPKIYATFEMWETMGQEEGQKVKDYFKQTFFTKEGWGVEDYKLAIFVGLLAGASAFWNGAALIALLLMLFFIAALSRKRLDFVIMAGLAGGLSLLQSNIFMKESNISAKYYFGFISENTTLFGSADYILRLIGILAIVVVAAFMYYSGIKRYLLFVFATPFIFAFTVSLTIDPTVNHKYIMISCMMLDVIVAGFIADIMKKKDVMRRIGGVILIFLLTATGIYDTYSIYVKNGEGRSVCIDLDEPVTEWVKENADSTDIFLTAPYTVNKVTMGGAMLYNGWQYFAWSAGYDTAYRDTMVTAMFNATSPEELSALVEECGISYIVVDADCRAQQAYSVREDVIAATYEAVYTEGADDGKLTIYDTALPLN